MKLHETLIRSREGDAFKMGQKAGRKETQEYVVFLEKEKAALEIEVSVLRKQLLERNMTDAMVCLRGVCVCVSVMIQFCVRSNNWWSKLKSTGKNDLRQSLLHSKFHHLRQVFEQQQQLFDEWNWVCYLSRESYVVLGCVSSVSPLRGEKR